LQRALSRTFTSASPTSASPTRITDLTRTDQARPRMRFVTGTIIGAYCGTTKVSISEWSNAPPTRRGCS
jgi:hypothetical protein